MLDVPRRVQKLVPRCPVRYADTPLMPEPAEFKSGSWYANKLQSLTGVNKEQPTAVNSGSCSMYKLGHMQSYLSARAILLSEDTAIHDVENCAPREMVGPR